MGICYSARWLVVAGLLAASLAVPGRSARAQVDAGNLPGEAARVAYETGFAYRLKNDTARARQYLEQAVAAGGVYGDLARIELVRILATDSQTEAQLPGIRAVLMGFEDRTGIPRAWYASVQALEHAGRYAASLEMALELHLRFPGSELADNALLAAARLHQGEGHDSAALDILHLILKDYARGDVVAGAHLMLARIYGTPGEHYSPGRACAALEYFRPRFPGRYRGARAAPTAMAGAASPDARDGSPWDAEALRIYRDYCQY